MPLITTIAGGVGPEPLRDLLARRSVSLESRDRVAGSAFPLAGRRIDHAVTNEMDDLWLERFDLAFESSPGWRSPGSRD